MFIKKTIKRNKGSKKKYCYYQLVESYQTPKGPRHRLLVNIGQLEITEQQRKDLGKCVTALMNNKRDFESYPNNIKALAEDIQHKYQLKQSRQIQEQGYNKEDFTLVNTQSMEMANVRTVGAEYVCNEVLKEIEFDKILSDTSVPPRYFNLIKALVIGRLVSPGSERHTYNWCSNTSGLFELLGSTDPIPSLSSFYRANDHLLSVQNKIEEKLSKKESSLYDVNDTLLLFDLTNTFFEGSVTENNKARHGKSKEKRSDCKLLTLGLLVNQDGYAKSSKVFKGNQSEPDTLKGMLQSLIEQSEYEKLDGKIVVLDAGIATEDNIGLIKEYGMYYIVVQKSKKNFDNKYLQNLRTIRKDKNMALKVCRFKQENEVKLLCRSSMREKKEQSIKKKKEDKFIAEIKHIKEGLQKKNTTKKYNKINMRIGRLKEKYSTVAKNFEIEVVADDNKQDPIEKRNAVDIKWEKSEKGKKEQNKDGCYILRTNKEELEDSKIWELYVRLTKIEKAFESMKSHLGLRPVFHQKEGRSDTHLFISVIAYHVLHIIEKKLEERGDNRCWSTIREVLSTHVISNIEYDRIKDDNITKQQIRTCSNPTSQQKLIYKKLEINPKPLKKKIL